MVFSIYNADGTSFNNLLLRKAVVDSVVMSLGDKITGELYYKDNTLQVTMDEYIVYKDVHYVLLNPPTIVREGTVNDNGTLKGMTKYSFEFYHPMFTLNCIPFMDVTTQSSESIMLSNSREFSWIGTLQEFILKIRANLIMWFGGSEYTWSINYNLPTEKRNELSDVLTFNKTTVAEALKKMYEVWDVPYTILHSDPDPAHYNRFNILVGLPQSEIYASDDDRQQQRPFVFKMGQGVGLKNNSRNPRNNKIVTVISGYGSERNIPYGYPQIPWYGDQRWDWTKYHGSTINYDSDGKVTNAPADDAFQIYDGNIGGVPTRLIKHPYTAKHLMPPIYHENVFNKVSPYLNVQGTPNPNYDPDLVLDDFYKAINSEHQGYNFPNQYDGKAPSYETKGFDDIYPRLEYSGQLYAIRGAVPLKDDLSPATEWDETIDAEGNYNQSFFKISLPSLPFDLYASAILNEDMQINMRSGDCLGCSFTIQVDWEDYKNNFYDPETGKFEPTNARRDYNKYPNSSGTEIDIVVRKDDQTFGTLLPTNRQKPVSGDKFVVLGINLPEQYITQAEEELKESMLSYMLENNVYYFDYPLKFDEYFLTQNQNILSQIEPNSIIRFEFAGEQLQLYVKQITVKYDEKPLPQYDITLTDNIEVVLNQIGKVADDVEKLSTLISILRENYDRNVWGELSKKLSKVNDDTAQGYIKFLKGLQVGSSFDSGLLGHGGVFRFDQSDNRTYLEVDKMYVRVKAYFDTVEIRKYEHSSGNRVASAAGMKCSSVVPYGYWSGAQTYVPLDENGDYHYVDIEGHEQTVHIGTIDFYRCYYRVKDGDDTVDNDFSVGDMAQCRMTNVATGLNMHYFWRIVIGRNRDEHEANYESDLYEGEFGWIDLSNRAEETVGGYNYVGFDSASDAPQAGDDIFQLGNVLDTTRQGAILEYTTGADSPSYKIYQAIGLDTREVAERTQSYYDPFSMNEKDYVSLGYSTGDGRAYMNVYGDMYFGTKDGTTSYIKYNSAPASPQNPDGQKIKIKADIDAQSTFGGLDFEHYLDNTWTINDIYALLNGVQQQIDGAIDTWFYDYMPVSVDQTDAPDPNGVPVLWTGDQQSVPCQPYYDWFVADGGDPTTIPVTQPTSNINRVAHLGDIFYDNKTGYAFRFSNSGTEQAPVFKWVEITDSAVIKALQDAANAQDTADHKRRVFVEEPYPPYDQGDLWVNATYPANYTGDTDVTTDPSNPKYKNDLLRCRTPRTATQSFAITDWELASKYTDDTELLNFLDGYQGTLTTIRTQVDRKAETWRTDTDPSTQARPAGWLGEDDAEHVGDLWMNIAQNAGHNTYIYQATEDSQHPYAWVAQAVPDAVFDAVDGKSAIFVNDTSDPDTTKQRPSGYKEKDLWILQRAINAAGNEYIKGEILTAIADEGSNGFQWADWQKEVGYTNDDTVNAFLDRFGQILNITPTPQSLGEVAGYLGKVLNTGETNVTGGLVLTNIIYLKDDATPSAVQAGISGLYRTLETGTGYKGHGTAAWYGGGVSSSVPIDHEVSPSLANYAKILFRFDGSGYLAGGNITWDANGSVTIKNITTLSDSQNTNLLNELATFNSAFSFATSGSGSTTVLSITPNVPFTSLSILDTSVTPNVSRPVATQYWVQNNFVTKDFFEAIFKPEDSSGNRVATNGTTTNVLDRLKILVGAYTDKYLSALGLNPNSGGGGGGGTGDVTWTALASAPTGGRTINYGYISAAVSAQGFATQSWVLSKNYLTTITSANVMSALGFTITGTAGSTYNLSNFLTSMSLSGLTDTAISSLNNGQFLVYDANYSGGAKWKNASLTAAMLNSAYGFTITGTASGSYNLANFLTTHQTIYKLSIYGGTTKVLDYTPNSAAASIYIKAGDGLSLTNDTTNKYITLSHPTNGANTTISAANGKVLSAITVNNLGHVTSVSSKTLAAADIPDISATYATSSRVTTLEGYFTNGVANNAARLTTVSKTAWGQTYWTANGVPDSITGAMTGVTTIDGYVSFTERLSSNPILNISTIGVTGGKDYVSIYVTSTDRPLVLQMDAGNVGVGTSQPSYKLDVTGSIRSTSNAYFCTTSGSVGIGTSSPSYKLHVNGSIYTNSTISGVQGIELNTDTTTHGTSHGGHLDFHFNGSTADYTSRIIELAAGTLHFKAKNSSGTDIASSFIIGNSTNGDYIQIGAIKIVYDSSNNALKVIKSDDTAANLYATGGISALGYGLSGGGGGGTGDVTWDALASTATNNRHIDWSYISAALANRYLPLTGGQVTGDLTVTGNLIIGSNIAATRSWVSSSYLPLTGGTISALSGNSPLTIKPVSGQSSYINFADSNGNVMGKLGVNNGVPRFYNQQTSTSYDIWHYGNFPVYIGTPSNGQVLKYNSTNSRFEPSSDTAGSGTVTSITLKAGTGISLDVDNTAITTSGTRTISIGSTYQTYISHGESAYNSLGNYVSKSGTSTSSPITGVLYIKDTDGLYINSTNQDFNIWQIVGNSGSWASEFGFNLQYLGTGSGNNNDLILWAHNQTGTHIESYRIHQDGQFVFKSVPYVGNNAVWHAGNLTKVSQLTNDSGYITSSGSITGNAATATTGSNLSINSKTAEDDCVPSNGRVTCYYANPCTAPTSDAFILAFNTGGYVAQLAIDVDRTNRMAVRMKNPSLTWTSWASIITSDSIGSQSVSYATSAGSAPASDVYSWAKASTKPSYNLDEVSDGSTRKLSNYLPLTGGTLTGNITVPQVHINDTVGSDSITFVRGNYSYIRAKTEGGKIGFITDGKVMSCSSVDFAIGNGWVSVNNAVSGAGGYNLYVNGSLNATTIYQNGVALGARAFDSTNYLPLSGGTISGTGTVLLSISSSSTINYSAIKFQSANHARTFGIKANGELFVTNIDGWAYEYVIIDSNNIGSQSVNYATSAGSVSWSNVSGRPTALSSFTNDSGYITSSGSITGNAATATTGSNLSINSKTAEDDCVPSNGRVTCYYANPCTAPTSDAFILAFNTGGYVAQLAIAVDRTNRMAVRMKNPSLTWTSWADIITSSNIGQQSVASAAKLTTSRTIWGASFDGTANITNTPIEGVFERLVFSRESWNYICVPATNGILSFNVGAAGTANTKMCITNGGNVGIGTTNPSYKLHVLGDVGMTGVLYGAQGIKLNSDSTYHGSVHGGYIDFHYNGASSYTTRLIEGSSGVLSILGSGLVVGSANGSYIQIGDIRIGYDSTNNALKVYKIVNGSESVANLYALGGISALGYGSSGGSGTVGDVTWSALSSSSDTRQIASSHLTTALSQYVLTTALSDYLSKSGGTMQSTATINWSLIGTENPSLYIGKHTRSGISSDLVFSLRTSPSYGVTNDVFYVTTGGKLGVSGGFELNCLAELKDNINVYYGGVKRLYFYTPSTNVNILQVTGYGVFSNTVTATNFITSSDTRKKDIIDYDANIDLWSIAYAPAIHFTWKNSDDKSVQVGSIAQYWKSVFPDAVKEGYDGYLSMQYDVLALLSAISIAKKTIDHERRISELERENELLRYEIDKLKAA